MPTRAMSLKLWPLMIIASFIIALPQPVFTDGLNHVQVKRSETAYFKFHFYSLWPDVTTCEWHKGHCKLTVSKKYQFSPLPQIDPRNSSTVLCSLEVLNVSVDDEGKYFCTVYYKNFSMKHNLKQVELKIAGTSSNDSGIEGLDSGEFLGVVGASAVSIFIVGAILYKKASVLNLLRTCLLFCKKICQEEPSSGEDEPLCNRGTTQSSPGDENQNGDDERDGPTRHQPVPIISNGINAPPAQGGLHQGGNRNINIAHNYGSVNLTHRDGGEDAEPDGPLRQSHQPPVPNAVDGINSPPGQGYGNQSHNTGIIIQGSHIENVTLTQTMSEPKAPQTPSVPSDGLLGQILDLIAVDLHDSVNTDSLSPYLLQYNLISPDEHHNLTNQLYPPGKRADFLLSYLRRKGIGVLQKFLKCLYLADDHLGHKDIADKLKEQMQLNGINCDI